MGSGERDDGYGVGADGGAFVEDEEEVRAWVDGRLGDWGGAVGRVGSPAKKLVLGAGEGEGEGENEGGVHG